MEAHQQLSDLGLALVYLSEIGDMAGLNDARQELEILLQKEPSLSSRITPLLAAFPSLS